MLLTLGALGINVPYVTQYDAIDVFEYHCYAVGFWQGGWVADPTDTHSCAPVWASPPQRFHAFPTEYPAAALAVFSLPLLTPWWPYATAYALWIALVVLVATAVLARRGPPTAAIALPLYVLLAGWGFTLMRYDLIVGLCVLLSLVWLQRGRYVPATVALALGTLLKITPLVLLPVLLIALKRRDGGRWRLDLAGLFVAICLAVTLPALALNPSATLAPLQYLAGRPLQLESLPGLLFWLSGLLGLAPGANGASGPYIAYTYNSLNVAGSAQVWWSMSCLLAGIAAIVLAYRRAWRGQDSPGRSVIVVLLILLVSGKAASPQYILWILPLAAVIEGLRLRWLLISGLVCLIMLSYFGTPLGDLAWTPTFLAAIMLRNVLLLGLVAIYLLTPGDLVTTRWPQRPLWRTLLDHMQLAPGWKE
jgi:uncharacterized membrane protein